MIFQFLVAMLFAVSALANPPSLDQAKRLFEQREYKKASVVLDEVIKTAGDEAVLGEALKTKLEIGRILMRRSAKKFAGILPRRGSNPGLEILNTMAAGPRAPWNELASFEIASSFFEIKEFESAEAAYQAFKASFPLSSKADDAQFYRALSVFKRIPRADQSFDQLQTARERFDEYLALFPSGSHAQETGELIQQICEMQGTHLLHLAEFYKKRGQHEAARIYLDKLHKDFAETKAAKNS